ncbi:hypothetical protein [Streptomyces sp. NPDC018833]|uniref:hypothetical protein n=1 Tax=Streptomyces sp. NPDC018833 TaxID=3365053 RepID=UPI0037AD3515
MVIGSVSGAGQVLLEPVRGQLRLHTLVPVTVRASVLGEQAVAYGVVRHALDALDAAEGRMTAG